MRSFFISDNSETYVAMRLAGLSGVICKDEEEARKNLVKIRKNKDIGILIITEKIFGFLKSEILEIKLKKKFPLIVEIPSNGEKKDKDFLTKYIKESIGM